MRGISISIAWVLVLAFTGCQNRGESTLGNRAHEQVAKDLWPLNEAHELLAEQDLENPLVAMLIADIGRMRSEAGQLKEAVATLEFLRNGNTVPTLLARNDASIPIASAMASAGELNEAIAIADEIKEIDLAIYCQAIGDIAKVLDDQQKVTMAVEIVDEARGFVDLNATRQNKVDSYLDLIKAYARIGSLDEAKRLSSTLEAEFSDRRGWAPIAIRLALDGDEDAAKTVIESKLSGLDRELYDLVSNIRETDDGSVCRMSIRQIRNSQLASMAYYNVAESLAAQGMESFSRVYLALAGESMKKITLDRELIGKVLAHSVSATAAVSGLTKAKLLCEEMKGTFSPMHVAEAYWRLSDYEDQDSRSEGIAHLQVANAMLTQVEDPILRTRGIRQVYSRLGRRIGLSEAVASAKKISSPIDRSSALIGAAEVMLTD